MDFQNHAYALTQIAHNFGAVAVVAAPLCALFATNAHVAQLACITLTGWLVQFASGAGFGLVSLYYYGALPDIHGTAVASLVVKVACAVVGTAVSLWLLGKAKASPGRHHRTSWLILAGAGPLALTAAALLRWFS